MVRTKETKKKLFSYLDTPRTGEREQKADMVEMTIEFMKYQGEVAYEIGKRQAIAISSTATTVAIGWSAFFIGISQEAWFTSSLGLMMVFAGTFILGYWTPKLVDGVRRGLIEVGAAKFYKKWLSRSPEPEAAEQIQ